MIKSLKQSKNEEEQEGRGREGRVRGGEEVKHKTYIERCTTPETRREYVRRRESLHEEMRESKDTSK